MTDRLAGSTSPGSFAAGCPRTTAILLIGAMLISLVFLVPVINDPDLARRGDDYWAFSEWFGSGEPYPHTAFGPLYPLFLRLLRDLGLSVAGVIAAQKVLVLISGYLIFRLGRHFGMSACLAALAGVGYTLYPIVQGQSSLLFTETLYLTLLLGALVFLIPALDARKDATYGQLLPGFVLLGLAGLTRGNALILYLALGLVALWRCPPRKVLIAGVIGALPILFWSAMNFQWYGQFKPTSSGDFNVAALIVGPVYLKQEGKPEDLWPDVWIEGDWHDRFSNPFEYARYARDQSLAWAAEHPVPVVTGQAVGWLKSLVGPGRQDFVQSFGPKGDILTVLSLLIRITLLLGLLTYLLTGIWRRQPTFSLLLALILVAHVLPAGSAGFARFGFPVDAFSTIALGLVIAVVVGNLAMARQRPKPRQRPVSDVDIAQ